MMSSVAREPLNKQNRHQARARQQAQSLLAQPQAAASLAQRAGRRAERLRGRLGEQFDELQSFIRLVLAWVRGEYRQVSASTLVAVLGALIYFLMPLDAMPDFIFAFGLLDDLAIVAKVVELCRRDLSAFRRWEQQSADSQQQGAGTDQ